MPIIKKPELLAPAGSWPSLLSAVQNGADSVYFGVKGANMRASANNFELSEIKKVMGILHGQKRKGYLALNTIVMNGKMDIVRRILEEAKEKGVDAVILWDMGVLNIAKQMGLEIHLSTQASVANLEAVQFYYKMGIKRIVLARECTLQEVKEIKENMSEKQIYCEIETFVHGAMCLSVSGRCFMSKYAHNRSANQGQCTQPCRKEYEIRAIDGEESFLVGQDYVLSPKDLCAIDFIDELINAGVDSFKIEGRARSAEYSSAVTSIYRDAIDAHYQGRLTLELKEEMKKGLRKVYNRGFSSGFYFGEPDKEKSRQLGHTYEKVYVGEVKKFYKRISVADILVQNNGLRVGEEILIFGKQTPASYTVIKEIQKEHCPVSLIKKGERGGVKVPFEARKGDKVFLWKERKFRRS